MAGNFSHVPGVKYLAGVTFQSEYGVHEAGTVVKQAEKFPNLEVLVSAHYLWPYAPEKGYEWLPPHLFNDVRTMKEVKAALAGDASGARAVPQFRGEKPQEFKTAEAEAEAQVIIRAAIKSPEQPGVPSPGGPTVEEVAEGAQPRTAKKTAKKAAAKEES